MAWGQAGCHWDVCRAVRYLGSRELFLPLRGFGHLYATPAGPVCWVPSTFAGEPGCLQTPRPAGAHGQCLGWWSQSTARCLSATGVSLSCRLGCPALSNLYVA